MMNDDNLESNLQLLVEIRLHDTLDLGEVTDR